jgi:hypothetical protein
MHESGRVDEEGTAREEREEEDDGPVQHGRRTLGVEPRPFPETVRSNFA